MPDTPLDFDQLEYEGYTVVHGFMDRARTQRIRKHMDSLLPPTGASREDPKRWHHVLRHPIPGAIMADLLNDPALLTLAIRSLQARELRLLGRAHPGLRSLDAHGARRSSAPRAAEDA